MHKKRIFLPLMIVLILLLTACTTDNINPKPNTNTPPVENQEQTTGDTAKDGTTVDNNKDADISKNEYKNIKIKPEEAFDIYMEKYPNTKVKELQLDKEKDQYIYKVKGFEGNKEYEVKIDPINGTIIKEYTETDRDKDHKEIIRANVEKVMAMVDKAITDSGEDSSLEEWTIDIDDGKVKLEVEINKKGLENEERTYDVETGELLDIDY